MKAIFSVLVFFSFGLLHASEKVTFYTSDSLLVTADLYFTSKQKPFILLFHQAGYSRGEYLETARRLQNLDYNCLAVDLRSGGEVNYVPNETAREARKHSIPNTFIDAQKDIQAAIKFARRYNDIPVILFGSSYSASLCLMEAVNNNRVKAVVAFSPGEYFRPTLSVAQQLSGLDKPVFISVTEMERRYIDELTEGISSQVLTIYSPQKDRGVHGAKALWPSNTNSSSYWFELMVFFKSLAP